MFWIHGGAFIFGSELGGNATSKQMYNGTNLAIEHNVVVVSTQYRFAFKSPPLRDVASMNVFGFLALPALQAESLQHNTTGNYAMQDQRAALKWVQNNIRNLFATPHPSLHPITPSQRRRPVPRAAVRPERWRCG